MRVRNSAFIAILSLTMAGCSGAEQVPVSAGFGSQPTLPASQESWLPTVNIAPAKGWPANTQPVAAEGTSVTRFADGLQHPRWVYVLPNGDVLIAETDAPPKPEDSKGVKGRVMKWMMKRAGSGEPSANRIALLRDTNGDGIADQRSLFLQNLNSPFGMTLVGNDFYVANTDAVLKFPYREGQTAITDAGTVVTALPAGPRNHHWTKNLIASADGSRLYVAVGSNSNVAENGMEVEKDRAAILEVDLASGNYRVFASGLRNPAGMAVEPQTGALWTVVNERDGLGNDLVPDYMTSVRDGGFYGWPYSYFGNHVDTRVQPQQPDLVATAIVPDYALGSHTASLGLAWSDSNSLPFKNGMFIGQHGSWNRRPFSGYKVIFVPFSQGKAVGQPVDVLTGFLSKDGEALGRPVGVALDKQGALLVVDDVGDAVWRVAAKVATPVASQ